MEQKAIGLQSLLSFQQRSKWYDQVKKSKYTMICRTENALGESKCVNIVVKLRVIVNMSFSGMETRSMSLNCRERTVEAAEQSTHARGNLR